MIARRPAIALPVLALAASSMIAAQGGAQDVRCHWGDQVRQVEVQLSQDGDGLPCRVIYIAGSDQIQLSSYVQLDFCTKNARELVHRLMGGGWICDARVTASTDRSAPAASVRPEPAPGESDAPLRPHPKPGAVEQAARSAGRAQEEVARPGRAVSQPALDVKQPPSSLKPTAHGAETEERQGFLWCLWASFDWMLPFIELDKGYTEAIARLQGGPYYLLYFQALAGYVLAGFLAAGLAGLTQSRG